MSPKTEMDKIMTSITTRRSTERLVKLCAASIAKAGLHEDTIAVVVADTGMFFAADLLRILKRMNIDMPVKTVQVERHGSAICTVGFRVETSSKILFIDVVCNTGETLAHLSKFAKSYDCDVKTAVFLDRGQLWQFRPDFAAFVLNDVPQDQAVVGYGVSHNGLGAASWDMTMVADYGK